MNTRALCFLTSMILGFYGCSSLAFDSADSSLNSETIFWSFNSNGLEPADASAFNTWYRSAKFKDISPLLDNAYFMKGPWNQNIQMTTEGELYFERSQTDSNAHTMLEISVNDEPQRGRFVLYDGYRSMNRRDIYEFEFEIRLGGASWWREVPWVVVFQGHAMPDLLHRGRSYNPPFSIRVSRGKWIADIRAHAGRVIPYDKNYDRNDPIYLGNAEARWTRFRVRARWGSTKDHVGALSEPSLLMIWKDDVLVHQESGNLTFYNFLSHRGESLGPYVTFGAYTPLLVTNEISPIRILFRNIVLRISPE